MTFDAHYAGPWLKGLTSPTDLDDAFFGERRYEATDLEGHRWHFGERFEVIVALGGGRRPRPRRPSRLSRDAALRRPNDAAPT